MKARTPYIIALAILLLTAYITVLDPKLSGQDVQLKRAELVETDRSGTGAASPDSEALKDKSIETFRVELEHIEVSNQNEPKSLKPNALFSRYTKPTSSGVIKNDKGTIIFSATKSLPIIGVKSIATSNKIVVISGNRKGFLINTETGDSFLLPEQSGVLGAKGFESWNWIGSELLLGVVHVQLKEKELSSHHCCEDGNIESTRIFLFDVSSKLLSEIKLPDEWNGKAFHLGKIAEGQRIELVPCGKDGSQLRAWFHINRK